ncbi:hypothetical protein V2J09_020002 [Rumex salicifolius]
MTASAVFSQRRWPDEAHVLAVDDSLVDRKVIEKLLRISSCKVTAVDSGRRALEFLGIDEEETNSAVVEELKVDLIITDYCMPGMTGYDLLKKIKESSAFRDVPVVIMSSENVLPRINRCMEEGAEDFIVKPVKLSDVKRLKHHLMTKECKINTLGRSLINNKRKLSDGPDLSTSPTLTKSSPASFSSISTSPASTPSPPSSSQPSPSPSLEPLDSPNRAAKSSIEFDRIISDSPL